MLDTVIHGDCLEVLRHLQTNSIDSCVTDPPYGLGEVKDFSGLLLSWLRGEDGTEHAQKFGFMNKEWDNLCPSPRYWKEIYRVMKPGAHLLVFAGTRTWDLMSMAIRLAGFENRDTLASEFGAVSTLSWVYGEGFPKSHNAGDGWGSALKPAWEPVLVFRKSFASSIAHNIAHYKTGALNIDGCRVPYQNTADAQPKSYAGSKGIGTLQEQCLEQGARLYSDGLSYLKNDFVAETHPKGRWPANFLLIHSDLCTQECCEDDCPVARLNAQAGVRRAGGNGMQKKNYEDTPSHLFPRGKEYSSPAYNDEKMFASRYYNQFYYEAKARKRERNLGVADKNLHPTVKPVKILQWLQRLCTPENGIILDPFVGSGTSCVAAIKEGFHFIGIEREEEYCEIAQERIAYAFQERNA